MVHAGHVAAHRHAAHHVGHRQPLRVVQCRHVGLHSGAWRERRTRVAHPVDRLGKDGVGPVVFRLHDHVVGLGGRDPELVDGHGFHVLPIGGDHLHLQSRNTQIENALRGAVDDPQPDLFARFEQAGPVAVGRCAIHEIGVVVPGDIGQVGRTHAHLVPHLAFGKRLLNAHARRVASEIDGCWLVEIVEIAHLLQVRHHGFRVVVGPVGEQEDMVALGLEALAIPGFDDDGAIDARLFLEAGMAVVPIRPALLQVEFVDKRLARRDAVEAETRHAVHAIGQQHAVPVDRTGDGQAVGHTQSDRIALAPTKHRPGKQAVDRGRRHVAPRQVDRRRADDQVKFFSTQHMSVAKARWSRCLRPRAETAQKGSTGDALNEGAAGWHARQTGTG